MKIQNLISYILAVALYMVFSLGYEKWQDSKAEALREALEGVCLFVPELYAGKLSYKPPYSVPADKFYQGIEEFVVNVENLDALTIEKDKLYLNIETAIGNIFSKCASTNNIQFVDGLDGERPEKTNVLYLKFTIKDAEGGDAAHKMMLNRVRAQYNPFLEKDQIVSGFTVKEIGRAMIKSDAFSLISYGYDDTILHPAPSAKLAR